ELQRSAAGRTAQRNPVPLALAGESDAGGLAGRLQPQPTTLAARLADADRICRHLQPATGSGAALDARLRASPRRSPRPDRPNQPPESTSRWIEVGGNVSLA